MSVKSLMFLTSALASAGLVIEPVAATANGLSQLGTWDCRKPPANLFQI
jgi:hypothetical protein